MNETSGGGQLRFNTTLFTYFVGLLIVGLLAWGNLKGDLREFFAVTNMRLDQLERRINQTPPERQARRR